MGAGRLSARSYAEVMTLLRPGTLSADCVDSMVALLDVDVDGGVDYRRMRAFVRAADEAAADEAAADEAAASEKAAGTEAAGTEAAGTEAAGRLDPGRLPATGRDYWYNAETGESSFEMGKHAGAARCSRHRRRGAPSVRSWEVLKGRGPRPSASPSRTSPVVRPRRPRPRGGLCGGHAAAARRRAEEASRWGAHSVYAHRRRGRPEERRRRFGNRRGGGQRSATIKLDADRSGDALDRKEVAR